MNRKKGFTLVELLAVIAILAIILTILAPSLLTGVKGKKEDALNKMYDLIELAARNYVMDYDIDTPTIIEMEDLCKTNYIECPILNPETEKELNGYVFAGNDFFYGEDESIELIADFNVAEPNQTFNETYAPGTVIDLQDVSKESYEFLGWEVVEGNSFIKDNKLIIGTTSTLIKPKLVRYLNDYIKYLYNDESTRNTNGIIEDDTADKNIRYAGSDPNNYVYFNCEDKDSSNISYGEDNYNYEESCEVWRIIGVFDVDNGKGNVEKRVKLINTESTFEASWDSSASDVNVGSGINQWGPSGSYKGADLMQLLNGYYIGKSGSTCRYCDSRKQDTCENVCDTSENTLASQKMKPLTSVAKNMIKNAVWDTYAVKYPSSKITDSTYASTAYLQEKGISNQYTGKSECDADGGDYCNDTVNRTTSWTGLVGLMSVSDITYANGWLYNGSKYPWSISPNAYSDNASVVWYAGVGSANCGSARYASGVWPALYLDSNIQITGGNGTSNLPYVLDLNSGQ